MMLHGSIAQERSRHQLRILSFVFLRFGKYYSRILSQTLQLFLCKNQGIAY
jgi:hypothetical protein